MGRVQLVKCFHLGIHLILKYVASQFIFDVLVLRH